MADAGTLDSYQRDIATGLGRAFDSAETETRDVELDDLRLIVFSDHHKGSRDGADDFRRCERAYQAALGYYLEQGHSLFTLGDVEELWENSPDEVLEAYPQTLALEAEFQRRGRYVRFWGNHDDDWRHPAQVAKRLEPIYPGIEVREALRLRVLSGGEQAGLFFFAHGHQGTLESERFSWFSRIVVRHVWRPVQRRFGFSATTPATDWGLRAKHNEAMYVWARSHPANPILIAGHTHKPVFGTSQPPKPDHPPRDEIEQRLREAEAAQPPDRERIAALRAELEWIAAGERSADPPPIPVDPPCYFNTGCCSFPDGDVTGIEIADGEIRLVRWPTDDERPLPKVLVSDELGNVLEAVRR